VPLRHVLNAQRAKLPACGGNQDVEDAIFGGVFSTSAHFALFCLTGLLDRDIGQVADDGVHILADITDFGEFRGFHLDEWRIGQAGQRRAISVLPTPVGPIIRMFLGVISPRKLPLNLLSSPAVAQGNGYSALGLGLPDDVFVELGNDFLRSHIRTSIYCGKALHLAGAGPSSSTSMVCCMLV
jgi:hypothetical protein